jgi:hypothetical protein
MKVIRKPSFATTVQAVYCIYTSTSTCFGLRWPSSSGTHNIIYKEVIILIIIYKEVIIIIILILILCAPLDDGQ